MTARFFKIILLFAVIAVLFLPNFQSLAEENLEEICEWEKIEEKPENLSDEEYEALLKKCQAYYQLKSEEIGKDITKTEQEKKTLQNKIYTLGRKVEDLNYQIYQSNVMIRDVGSQIVDTEDSIGQTSLRINDSQNKLANILQLIYEEDQKSLIEVLLSEAELSDFFDNLMALESLNSKSKEFLINIKNLKSYLEEQKDLLDEEKIDLENVLIVQQFQKQESEETKVEQEYFLKMTEEEYQQYLKEKEETEEVIENIGAMLWRFLIGAREIPEYGEAVEIAKTIEEQTGVRAAFLLGILTQESQIGRNVGQCFLQDFETGMGTKVNVGNWPRVMKPTRDVPIFLEIIEDLNKIKGLDLKPTEEPISCWIPYCATYYQGRLYTCGASVSAQGNIACFKSGYVSYGWGGAMGPAQFIPSTWNSVKDRVEQKTGIVADPWDFRDAALASGLFLTDCGVAYNERSAAACYFGGWGNRNSWWHLVNYGDPVLGLAKCHQDYIDNGAMSANCQQAIGLK